MKINNTKSGVFQSKGAKTAAVPVSGVIGKPRYSNRKSTDDDDDDESFWKSINWNGIFSDLSGTISSIFGKSDKYTAAAQKELIKQQNKINTILWVVVGLMAAVGIVLLIRKTR